MGQRVSRTEFEWVHNDQPHIGRRDAMLKKYPEIKKLFGPDPSLKLIVSALVLIQFIMLYVLQDQSWKVIVLVAYIFGGVINHSLMVASHEIVHNIPFGHARPLANRYFGMWCNIPIGVPFSVTYKKYHTLHHKYLAEEALDHDIPTVLEAKLFSTTLGKLVFLIVQPIFFITRPFFVNPMPIQKLEIINAVVQVAFDALVVFLFGWKMLSYLLICSFFALSLHPISGHLISDHYMFKKGFETYSYYGPLNWIHFNVGYHNEHHDFPAIPGSKLPEVKKIAPEFYETIPYHTSYLRVMYDFVRDPTVGLYARIKRKPLEKAG
ncbi:sphingolipid delta(4)-desaturase DES1-like [Topomyia yanbarensis]|uniref:sphingolipid delta(4)-desaturase DES1-like n=1 Tax=Topomyia yanbarensis TaxID=2498891 RepID=UPI00273AA219|nr:sphingolipid delta(4)-desaturase DES1-like [Topomyia yanbarensis]